TPVTEVVPLVEPVAAPDVIDLAELPEEPGLTSEPLVAVAALSAVGRTTAGSDRAAGAAPPLPPTGRHDAFAELADLDGTEGIRGLLDSDPDSDDHVDSHDWWDFGDVSQRDDDRGGFRAAADATEAIEFSPTEQVRLGPGDLAAPPTASKASDLDSLGGPESKTYEDALHAFFDSPADRDPADGDTGDRPADVAPGRKTPDLFQTADTDLARASDELDEVDRWVEDTEDTHGDWLERTKRTTLANLMGALMALLAVVGLVLATVWVVNNL
ncbi:MAG: hypothetical protein KDB24_04535, partial [Microthrixaceae bacterium]|nr:hypothetical protein [Microthrixaceae bacterium]